MNAVMPKSFALTPAKAVLLIALLGWLAYANSLTKAFMLDDYPWILENDAIADIWRNTTNNPQRPLAALTVSLNHWIGGSAPAGYHAVNVGIHIAAALALFGTIRRTLLLPRWHGRWDDASVSLAFAAAAIWVVHPLNTHAVTYLIQRCESGMGLGYILALYCLVRGSQSSHPFWWNFGAVTSAWFSLGFKEVAITLVPVAIIYDRCFLADSWGEMLRRRWYVYLGLAGVIVPPVIIHFGQIAGAEEATQRSIGFELPNLDPKTYFLTEIGVLVYYLRLGLWPVGLCFDYLDWSAPSGIGDWLPAFALLTAGFLACAIGLYYRNGFGFLGMSMYLTLSITSSFIPIADVANEYRMYVPLMALATGVVIFAHLAIRRFCPGRSGDWLAAGLLASAVVALTALTYLRNEDYRSLKAMWDDVIAKRPGNYRAYESLAYANEHEFQWDKAKENHKRALELVPGAVHPIVNLAFIAYHEGRTKEAIDALKVVEQHSRTHADSSATRLANMTLAMYQHFEGNSDESIALLEGIAKRYPGLAQPRLYLGQVFADLGRADEARAEFQKAIELAPQVGATQRIRIQTLLRGRMGESPQVKREALFRAAAAAATLPDDADAQRLLAQALEWNKRRP